MSFEKKLSRRALLRAAAIGSAAFGLSRVPGFAKISRAGEWTNYRNAAVKAAKKAVSLFSQQASLSNVLISSVVASGGKLSGPDLSPAFVQEMRAAAVPAGIADAWAKAVSAAWHEWQSGVHVPGLPWYPAFAAFPGPMAPPTPNVPTPIASLTSSGAAALGATPLTARILTSLGKVGETTEARIAVAEFSQWFATSFTIWQVTGQVTNVMGKGPIPAFAPPYVPIGPVVMGDNIAAPGHLALSEFGLVDLPSFTVGGNENWAVGAAAQLKLEAGKVLSSPTATEIEGSAFLSLKSNPNLQIQITGGRFSLSDTLPKISTTRRTIGVVGQQAASSSQLTPTEKARLDSVAIRAGSVGGQPTQNPPTATTKFLVAAGNLRFAAAGASIELPGAVVQYDPAGALPFIAGAGDVLGAPFAVSKGLLATDGLTLSGFVNYGPLVATDVVLKLSAQGVGGTGKVNAFGHQVPVRFSSANGKLIGDGVFSAKQGVWKSLTSVDGLEYMCSSSRLQIRAEGGTITTKLGVGRVSVRTKATKPDGTRWASAELKPAVLVVQPNGDIALPLPALRAPGDIFKDVRDKAQQAASLILDPAARQAAVDKANHDFPLPPNIGAMPSQIQLKVGDIVG